MSKGVLLVNLGSPDSPSVPDVRRYLNEFLMDGRVIDAPWLLRRFIVGMVLHQPPGTIRRGLSQNLDAGGVAARGHQPQRAGEVAGTRRRCRSPWRCDTRTRPSDRHRRAGATKSGRSSADSPVSALRHVELRNRRRPRQEGRRETRAANAVQGRSRRITTNRITSRRSPPARGITWRRATTICCSASTACRSGTRKVRPDRRPLSGGAELLRSAQSGPRDVLSRAMLQDGRRVREAGGRARDKYSVSFQSRLGRDPWLKPYTDFELPGCQSAASKSCWLSAPRLCRTAWRPSRKSAFAGATTFLSAGGKEFTLIPCLNEHPRWIAALEKMIERF